MNPKIRREGGIQNIQNHYVVPVHRDRHSLPRGYSHSNLSL